ncbi:MAG: ROK family protein [Candidatus Eisenbacteria bacterium]
MRIGIDLGGTKIEGVLLGGSGEVLGRHRVPTPKGDYDATLDALAALTDRFDRFAAESGADVPTIGIGTPGAVSPATGRMKNCNSTWLNDRPLREDLVARIGREVRLANDANCFALSEAVDGAAAGAEVVFGVILGTGVGSGVVVRERPILGANAIGGEWGHNPLPSVTPDELPGPPCYCGRSGCVETFLSGPGLAHDHERVHRARLTSEEVVQGAAAGDDACEDTLRRYEHRLARALASVINLLDPDTIVLGGGLSKIERLYTNVPRIWNRWVFSDSVTTPLVPPLHGDASGVRGAAWLWGRSEASRD